ncbi:MAG TPA: hypothetical protein VGH27_23545 [Streptosporangiaceae bacterium]|jgi:hypothetical protein
MAALTGLALVVPMTGSVAAEAAQNVSTHFVLTASASQTRQDNAYIDNAATNGQPYNMLYVTPNFKPDNNCGCVYDANPIGVWYDRSEGQWAVFNEDGAPMPDYAEFNVLVGAQQRYGGGAVAVVKTNKSDLNGGATFINNAASNNNPGNFTFVTPNYNPHGVGGTYNDAQTSVLYFGSEEAVFNEDDSSPPLGSAYNLLILSS